MYLYVRAHICQSSVFLLMRLFFFATAVCYPHLPDGMYALILRMYVTHLTLYVSV